MMLEYVTRLAWVAALVGLVACADDDFSYEVATETLSDSNLESESQALYDEDAFESFNLVLSEKALKFLDDDPTAEVYVKGAMEYKGKSYEAGIRYKGSIGAWHRGIERCVGEGSFSTMPTGPRTCQKLSLKVSFNEYDDKGRFKGLRKVLFHAMNQDASLMRERLAYSVFREMGIAAPRASHARVSINGEFSGVYAFVEYIDGRFTRGNFSDGEGNLYKEVWPAKRENFTPINDETLLGALRTDEDEMPTFEAFKGMTDALEAAKDEDELLEVVKRWVDVDYMLRYLAADRATLNDDGVLHFYDSLALNPTLDASWYNHNFYWYESTDHSQLWLIPWDTDNTWSLGNPITRVNSEWNDLEVDCDLPLGAGGFSQLPPACDPFIRAFAHESLKATYKKYVQEVLDGPLAEDATDAKIARWSAQIEDAVAEASALPGELTVADWERAKTGLKAALKISRDQLASSIGVAEVEPPDMGEPMAPPMTVATVNVEGHVTAGQMGPPMKDVSVCLHGQPDVACSKTDAAGVYTLTDVPAPAEVVLTFDKEGMVPVARNLNLDDDDYRGASDTATTMWMKGTYIPEPAAGRGTLAMFPFGMTAGKVASIMPDDGVPALYSAAFAAGDTDASFDPGLTMTTSTGVTLYKDLKPGEYHVNFDGCSALTSEEWGLPATDGSQAARIRVIPDRVMMPAVLLCL